MKKTDDLKNKKTTKNKNKKGFTLIELLAVIVILGILMLVAIPSVTRFINESRQKTFRDTAMMLIDAVRNDAIVNEVSSTCYVDVEKINLEKGDKSNIIGYVVVRMPSNTNTGYTYRIHVLDKTNKFELFAEETEVKDIENIKFGVNTTSPSTVKYYTNTSMSANPTAPTPSSDGWGNYPECSF